MDGEQLTGYLVVTATAAQVRTGVHRLLAPGDGDLLCDLAWQQVNAQVRDRIRPRVWLVVTLAVRRGLRSRDGQ